MVVMRARTAIADIASDRGPLRAAPIRDHNESQGAVEGSSD
jgi:hypothetical protein